MKRKLAFILLLMVLSAIGFLGYSIYNRLEEKEAIAERIATLPEFSLANLEGEIVQSKNPAKKASLILTYFNTECHFCQGEIRSMQQHEPLQDQAIIYLVSDEPFDVLKQFSKEFKLDSLQTIQILWDGNRKVKELLGITGVPSTFVYDADGHLIKSFKGETKAEVLYELVK